VVWDSLSGVPVKTIFNPSPNGVLSLDISEDSLFIATIGITEKNGRELNIFAWTSDATGPICHKLVDGSDPQTSVSFHPSDSKELVTWGNSSVIFWNWHGTTIEGYVGSVSKSDVGHFSGKYTSSLFLEGFGNVITTTSEGYVILWEKSAPKKGGESSTRIATKVIRLMQCAITTAMTSPNGYLVLGSSDGAVRFYDFYLRLEAWFEDLQAGPVTSVSLAMQPCPHAVGEGGSPGLLFWVPDILVGTANGFIVGVESEVFEQPRADDRRGTLLLQGLPSSSVSCACHPSDSLVAIITSDNQLQIWSYQQKLLRNVRQFVHATPLIGASIGATKMKMNKTKTSKATSVTGVYSSPVPTSIAFHPSGKFIAVSFTNGIVKIVWSDKLTDVLHLPASSDEVYGLKFSASGQWMAGWDTAGKLLLFEWNGQESFEFVGSCLSHACNIVSVIFGVNEISETLISIGSDSTVVDYDLSQTTVEKGFFFRKPPTESGRAFWSMDVSQTASCGLWYPANDVEDRFVIAYENYKYKEYNSDSKITRKTLLAPTYGGCVRKMQPIIKLSNPNPTPEEEKAAAAGDADVSKSYFYAYSTNHRIIGIGNLPLSGNPTKHMGIVAHAGEVSDIAVSHDGKFLFSCGGGDLTVNMWAVEAVDDTARDENGMAIPNNDEYLDHMSLIEGGSEGALYNDIVDYYYYCQIRAQGEDSMDSREMTGRVPLQDIPNFMRAIGYYPSETEIDNMVNEIKYKNFTTTGQLETTVSLGDLIIMYTNHRPVVPHNSEEIVAAFNAILQRAAANNATDGSAGILFSELKAQLITEGEVINRADLDELLKIIADGSGSPEYADHHAISAHEFASDVLGFIEE
jgi:WD40 repeat protein/Ca2+-binding EF-hand superfamily protein